MANNFFNKIFRKENSSYPNCLSFSLTLKKWNLKKSFDGKKS